MKSRDERVVCRTPTRGKKPTRIVRWKYDLVREAVLSSVPRNQRGIEFGRLAGLVARRLSKEDLKNLGSVPWYATTVKLDLEVKGLIERVPGAIPQRLRRTK